MSRNSLIKSLCWSLLVLILLLLFVLPVVSGNLLRAGYMPGWLVDSLRTLESSQTWIMRGLIVAWLFFFGACFASFLNVVAWRVPRGRGINGSSYCPHCNVRLRMSDNMPIVGWLKNGGRCRDCKTPITVRYLIVELALGLVTLLLFALTVFWSGINLPGTGAEHRFDLVRNLIAQPRGDLIQIVCFHLVLVYALFTATVVRTEKLAVPRSVVLVFAMIGAGLSAFLPHSYVVDWLGNAMPNMQMGLAWLATIGLGVAAGAIAGWVLEQMPVFESEYKTVGEVDGASGAERAGDVEESDEDAMQAGAAEQGIEAASVRSDANDEPLDAGDDKSGVDGSGFGLESPCGPKGEMPVSFAAVSSVPDGVATLTLVGLFLGWQAVVTVGLILVCLIPVRRLLACSLCQSLASQVFFATLVQLIGWRLIASTIPF